MVPAILYEDAWLPDNVTFLPMMDVCKGICLGPGLSFQVYPVEGIKQVPVRTTRTSQRVSHAHTHTASDNRLVRSDVGIVWPMAACSGAPLRGGLVRTNKRQSRDSNC